MGNSTWVKIEGENGMRLPPIDELVWGYDLKRGINVICWRSIREDNYDGHITGTKWISYKFGDDIMISYWYPINPTPHYPNLGVD